MLLNEHEKLHSIVCRCIEFKRLCKQSLVELESFVNEENNIDYDEKFEKFVINHFKQVEKFVEYH